MLINQNQITVNGVSGTPVVADSNGNIGVGTTTPVTTLHVAKAGNNILTVERTNKVSGSGYFGINVENNSQTTFAYDNTSNFVIGTASDPSTQAGFSSAFEIDNTGLILGTPKPSTAQGISYGTQIDYVANDLSPAIDSNSNGWYVLIPGLDDGSYTFHLKTGAHSSIIFQVGTGYAASAAESLQILQFTDNPNSNYLNIKGVRVTDGGGVEVYLEASNPISFSMSVHAVGNGNFGTAIPFAATLSKQTGSPTVRDSAYPLASKTTRVNYLNISNLPAFHARGTGSWLAPGNATLTMITSHTNSHNDGGHYNTSNGRFTAPIAGKYFFGIEIYHRNDSGYDDDTNHQYCFIWKNGSVVHSGNNIIMGYQNNGDADASFSYSTVVKMNAGDYVEVRNSDASGSGSYYMPACEFYGHMIG